MSAVILTPTFDGRDGLSTLTREVTAAVSSLRPGTGVHVLTLAGAPSIPHATARVSGCAGSRTRLAARAVAAAAAQPAAVIVLHAHLLPLALPCLAAGTPLVHVLVGIEAWRRLPVHQAQPLRRAAAMVAISEHTRRRFVDANPAFASCRIHVCHPSTPRLPALQRRPGLPAPGFALMVGRMASEERYKGHDLLIDVWPRVCAEIPGVRLVMAGDGDDRARLQARATEAGLSAAIVFTGAVDDATLAALYADAGVFVLPSTDEGFGYVYLEAMDAGCPCLGARGASEEIIEDGVTGLIVDGGDRDGLTAALVRLFTRPAEARRMGEAGRDRARSQFAAARFVDDLGRALEDAWPC